MFTDDMAVNPLGVLEEVLEFLGLDLTHEDNSKASATETKLFPHAIVMVVTMMMMLISDNGEDLARVMASKMRKAGRQHFVDATRNVAARWIVWT